MKLKETSKIPMQINGTESRKINKAWQSKSME